MPIYNYRCAACGSEFELLVKLADVGSETCPSCESTDVSRLLSLVAPQGKSAGIIAAGRKQAAREGHFSHYSKAERAKVKT
ncbi:MAG: zinc ribbon domain-containing protein [Pseudomonadota bacterium]